MEMDKIERGMDNETVRVIVSEYQEDAFLVQLHISNESAAGTPAADVSQSTTPLTPRAARLIARHLLEAADMAEDNEIAMTDYE